MGHRGNLQDDDMYSESLRESWNLCLVYFENASVYEQLLEISSMCI